MTATTARDRATASWRRLTRAPSGRITNLQLLIAVTLTFVTGVGAVATGSSRGRWIVIAHGIVALVVVLLIPWKTRVVRGGLALHRTSRWASLALAILTIATLLFGIGYTTGLVRTVDGVAGMWLHVAAALTVAPLFVWHALARRLPPRRSDLSRRVLLRAGLLSVVGGGLYLGATTAVSLLGLPGRTRRFTGSYEEGSFEPRAMPNTIWLADTPPIVDPTRWRLAVVDGRGQYEVSLDQLATMTQTRRATLDCTSGWYAEQNWTGVPLSRLVRRDAGSRSVLVRSVTGYWIRLPVADLDTLLLATGINGQALSFGHGFPLRLVAPGRRGYWWVKWVDHIELQTAPSWWQPPFPLQ